MEFVQELLRPFVSELGDVREELGAERARRRIAEERAASLEAELQELREAGEAQKLPQCLRVRISPDLPRRRPHPMTPHKLGRPQRRARSGGAGGVGCSRVEEGDEMNQGSDIQEYSAGDSVRIRLQVEHEFEFSSLEAVFEHENFDPTIEGRGEETHAITLVGQNTEQLVRIDGVPPAITSFVMVEG
jgi:hypothetical protein